MATHGNLTLASAGDYDEVTKYERIESWCQQQIKLGSDFLFDPRLFRKTLEAKSNEWGFAYEVSDASWEGSQRQLALSGGSISRYFRHP